MYGYVGQNPINFVDPEGLIWGIIIKYAVVGLVSYGLSKFFKPNAKGTERFVDVCIGMASFGTASFFRIVYNGWLVIAIGGFGFSTLSSTNHILHNLRDYKNNGNAKIEVALKLISDTIKGGSINILTMFSFANILPNHSYVTNTSEVLASALSEGTNTIINNLYGPSDNKIIEASEIIKNTGKVNKQKK